LSALSTLKTLASLSLNLSGSYIGRAGLDPISLALSHLKSLTILNLDLDENEISHDNFRFFFENLSRLELLAIFHLRCQLTNEDLAELSSVLRTLKSLTILKLDLSSSKNLDDVGITNFSHILKDLPLLESLNLDFSYCDKKIKEGIKNLFDALKYIKGLKRLKLDFSGLEKIGYEELKYISHAVGDLNPSLTHFELLIGGTFMPRPIRLPSLFLSLKNLKYLTYLHLYLGEYALKEKDVEILSSTLMELKMLTDLKLCLGSDNSEMKVESMKNFCLALKELSSLTKLSLIFYESFRISGEAIVELCTAIRTLKNLTYLVLCFRESNELRTVLERVVDILKDIKSLSMLNLSAGDHEDDAYKIYSLCKEVNLLPILQAHRYYI